MASKDLEGIRERTPKRVGPFYDEPSGNERRLRGVAARTPKRTISMDEKYAKEAPVRHGMGTRAGAGRRAAKRTRRAPPMAVGGSGKLASLRAAPEKEPGGKIDLPETKADFPTSKRPDVRQETSKAASSPAPKKRGKLRRAIGGIAHGVGKAARYVGRTLKDNDRKRVTK